MSQTITSGFIDFRFRFVLSSLEAYIRQFFNLPDAPRLKKMIPIQNSVFPKIMGVK